MRVWLGTSAGLLLALGTAVPGLAQSADSPSRSLPAVAPADQQPGPARFDASQDSFSLAAADGLGLAETQRKAFLDNVQAVVHDALIINPYDTEGFADALMSALDMPHDERCHRMRNMRRVVAGRNVFGWASDILEGLESLWTRPLQYAVHGWEEISV